MRLHSGDSLGTGAAYAASVACAEEALLRREAASEAKRPKGPQGAALMRTECHAAFRASRESVSVPPPAAGQVEPGAEAACLFYGTPNAPQKRVAFWREPAQ